MSAPVTPDEVRDEWVEYLASEFAKVRTRGNVYMDGSHSPRPSERQAAQLFVRDSYEEVRSAREVGAELLAALKELREADRNSDQSEVCRRADDAIAKAESWS
jgi:hypothetical protein